MFSVPFTYIYKTYTYYINTPSVILSLAKKLSKSTKRKVAHGWGLTSKQKVTLIILILGAFVTVLNQTVVTPALPPIMAEMGIDAATAQWLTTGFTLVNAIMIPITALFD